MKQLGRYGRIILQHWEQHRPDFVQECGAQLVDVALRAEQQAEELLERTKEQLLQQHPVPDRGSVEEKQQHYLWVERTAWELIRDDVFAAGSVGAS